MLKPMSINAATDIAHIIQLAVAPVFLVAGIGTLLNVLTSRLARVVDRNRKLDTDIRDGASPFGDETFHLAELRVLDQRMSWISHAITLATVAVLLICLVVVALFAGELVNYDLSHAIAALFIAAMAALILGLLAFLVEISYARKMLRVRPELLASRAPKQ
jgi:type IV secretory pathway VirB6-like protein